MGVKTIPSVKCQMANGLVPIPASSYWSLNSDLGALSFVTCHLSLVIFQARAGIVNVS